MVTVDRRTMLATGALALAGAASQTGGAAFELKAGDIIYSGTPENVGPVVKGDVLLCKLEGLPDMSIRIT
jgi:2-keto-4-pentenoate hydratase